MEEAGGRDAARPGERPLKGRSAEGRPGRAVRGGLAGGREALCPRFVCAVLGWELRDAAHRGRLLPECCGTGRARAGLGSTASRVLSAEAGRKGTRDVPFILSRSGFVFFSLVCQCGTATEPVGPGFYCTSDGFLPI